jgi:23S rRNA-/tRNA-specific pseudouridylate synthase
MRAALPFSLLFIHAKTWSPQTLELKKGTLHLKPDHLLPGETGAIPTVLSSALQHITEQTGKSTYTALSAYELIDIGAVWHKRKDCSNKATRANQQSVCASGDYLRVHLNPRRYNTTQDIENLISILRGNDSKISLAAPHRLDTDTSGIIVIAKHKKARQSFCGAFRVSNEVRSHNGIRVRKFYRALVRPSPFLKTGFLSHWSLKSNRTPKLFLPNNEQATAKENMLFCRLCIKSISQPRLLSSPLGSLFSNSNEEIIAHEVKVELLTGRTHQIRGQLSQIGANVLGDDLYGGNIIDHGGGYLNSPNLALQASEMLIDFSGERSLRTYIEEAWWSQLWEESIAVCDEVG